MCRTVLRLLVVVLSATASLSGGGAVAAERPPLHIALAGRQAIDSRLTQLTFDTSALAQPAHVRVLLPAGYDSSGATRYPVLYLLHGSRDNASTWTDSGMVEQIVGTSPVIVVMPDGGSGGYYTDWYRHGYGGPPEWETFHIDQLIPWIDSHYRTQADRAGRAIAGNSMGGYGALSYAARHPDLFTAVASFSGIVDTNVPAATSDAQGDITNDGGDPDAAFGSRSADEIRWRAHNPWDLAANLRGMTVVLRTGDGKAGGPLADHTADAEEVIIHSANVSLQRRLQALHIPHVWDDYGPGQHRWPYWQRDLRETLPLFMKAFGHAPSSAASITFRAAEPTFTVGGWRVARRGSAYAFSTLAGARTSGFSLSGSGAVVVTTPPRYVAGRRYAVVVSGNGRTTRTTVVAGTARRLRISLTLARAAGKVSAAADAGPAVAVGIRPAA